VAKKFRSAVFFSPQSVGVRGQVAAGVPRCPPYGRPLRRVAAAAHRRRRSNETRGQVSRNTEEFASPSEPIGGKIVDVFWSMLRGGMCLYTGWAIGKHYGCQLVIGVLPCCNRRASASCYITSPSWKTKRDPKLIRGINQPAIL
jgi:hypothetical protein